MKLSIWPGLCLAAVSLVGLIAETSVAGQIVSTRSLPEQGDDVLLQARRGLAPVTVAELLASRPDRDGVRTFTVLLREGGPAAQASGLNSNGNPIAGCTATVTGSPGGGDPLLAVASCRGAVQWVATIVFSEN